MRSWVFVPRIWQPTRPVGVESFWRWAMARAWNRTFQLLIVAIKPVDVSPTTSFAMNLRRMPTTVRKGKRCAIAVSRSRLKAILIAPQRRNAKVVRRRSTAHQVPTAHCLSTGTKQLGRPYALWRELQPTSVRGGPDTRSKHSLPSSSSGGTAAATAAPIVECFRTVPVGSYCPELETAGAVPGATLPFARSESRVKARGHERKQ